MKKIKISEVKGRPLLNWIGKKTINIEESYPARLVETFNHDKKEIKLKYDDLIQDWRNLLFHGDNIEILTNLLQNGFREKIDLIYIDPPFDSKADYIRKVELRGEQNKNKLEGEGHNKIEQKQYFDIWKNDDYLQFMYERLILLKELLSDIGSIYLHCDWHKSHHLRCLLDEVFGEENFRNEIIWNYRRFSRRGDTFPRLHDNIFIYKKNGFIYNKIDDDLKSKERIEKGYHTIVDNGIKKLLIYDEEKTKQSKVDFSKYKEIKYTDALNTSIGDVWELPIINPQADERNDYPTQKPEVLMERIIKASSNEDSIIFDCFMGSGTTQAVAQKLGRKWIGSDINKGAIQTTSKRIQKIIQENKDLKYNCFSHFKVNDYDLQILRTEAIELAFEKLGIEKSNDTFFDGTIGDNLVKVIDMNHPLRLPNITDIKEELKNRTDEERGIKIVCLGQEENTKKEIEEWNRKALVNRFEIINLEDKKFMVHEPCQAQIELKDNRIQIKNFVSPTIIKRLSQGNDLLKPEINDFRAMIDCVFIDNDYNGEFFQVVYKDIPEKKNDLIEGEYKIEVKGKVCIKIIDMLGEELVEIL